MSVKFLEFVHLLKVKIIPKEEKSKGQLILKANCQAEDSSKKRTNEFVFTSMRHVFVRFLEESLARKKTRFEII